MTSYETQLPVRLLHVVRARRLTPRMARITFGGPDLADFRLDGPDQQVKLYFPKPGQDRPRLPEPTVEGGDPMRWYEEFTALPEAERPWMRSYTVRAHDPADATIDIDFVLHGGGAAGPATRWAAAAQPGDILGMFGPSAHFAKPLPLGAADWTLLAGDETALPALGTILEALPEGAEAVAYIEVQDAADEQQFTTRAELTVHWLHRGTAPAGHAGLLLDAVRAATFPHGTAYAWLAGEAGAVRGLRRHLVGERGVAKKDIGFAGYWRLRRTQDDAPTADDLADAQDLLAQAQA
ncbi:siderophore-interacting protein [Streptomyces sp. B-S-A8]|uniref:Siderophore-interacting protein n=1 Tax=Streptomyces solicavernae TaxID=3043614 RepID=A0ABT6RUD3_9ACTN|nr:siderophore-interacting protein [Streptomyces sp. B-S-A8]MDI3387368.1 siderophore-interacting protein [Streptomyces sp. B-S-A8]